MNSPAYNLRQKLPGAKCFMLMYVPLFHLANAVGWGVAATSGGVGGGWMDRWVVHNNAKFSQNKNEQIFVGIWLVGRHSVLAGRSTHQIFCSRWFGCKVHHASLSVFVCSLQDGPITTLCHRSTEQWWKFLIYRFLALCPMTMAAALMRTTLRILMVGLQFDINSINILWQPLTEQRLAKQLVTKNVYVPPTLCESIRSSYSSA